MVLKYLTRCEINHAEQNEEVFYDQWNFIDGIIGASVYFDEMVESTVVALEFESRDPLKLALSYDAYLLNENGKTIEKLSVYRKERKCSKCTHAHKVDDEYDKVYECDAEEYDIERLTCFVPKKE